MRLQGFVLAAGCCLSAPRSGLEPWLRCWCEGTRCMGSAWWVLKETGVWKKERLSETLVGGLLLAPALGFGAVRVWGGPI